MKSLWLQTHPIWVTHLLTPLPYLATLYSFDLYIADLLSIWSIFSLTYLHIWPAYTFALLTHLPCLHICPTYLFDLLTHLTYLHIWRMFTFDLLSLLPYFHRWPTFIIDVFSHLTYFLYLPTSVATPTYVGGIAEKKLSE